MPEASEKGERYVLDFGEVDSPLLVKVAVSTVDEDGAAKNYAAESEGRGFDEIRDAARAKWDALLGRFAVPVRDADIVAFNRFLGDEMADHLLEMARVVREECGRTRIVAAFYGYVFECYAQRVGPSQSGHFALAKVLASPDVDALCGPFSYSNDSRCPGCPVTTHTVGESVTFEGAPFVYPWKVWVGQVGETGGRPNLPMDGTVRSFWYFHQPLTKEEIDAL